MAHPSFNHDVGTDVRDRNITKSDRIREMRSADASDGADRIVSPQYLGSDEVNHPIHDTALQGRGVHLPAAFNEQGVQASPTELRE